MKAVRPLSRLERRLLYPPHLAQHGAPLWNPHLRGPPTAAAVAAAGGRLLYIAEDPVQALAEAMRGNDTERLGMCEAAGCLLPQLLEVLQAKNYQVVSIVACQGPCLPHVLALLVGFRAVQPPSTTG